MFKTGRDIGGFAGYVVPQAGCVSNQQDRIGGEENKRARIVKKSRVHINCICILFLSETDMLRALYREIVNEDRNKNDSLRSRSDMDNAGGVEITKPLGMSLLEVECIRFDFALSKGL